MAGRVVMTILATGTKPISIRGFTLVELLVVLIVLALLSGIVLMALPRQTSETEKLAYRLAVLTGVLSDEAVLEGRSLGLDVEEGRLALYRYGETGWQRRVTPREMGGLDEVFLTLTAGDAFEFEEEKEEGQLLFLTRDGREQEKTPPAPAVIFSPTGESTPFSLLVTGRDEAFLIKATGLNAAEVTHAPE